MKNSSILWIDDEVEHLTSHFIFLKEKGYQPTACTNGNEALDLVAQNDYDVVLLDENMPGMSGLETLAALKAAHPQLPIVMITKNEEEVVMNEALGGKISDYLIKPVNPNQILLALKKILQHKDLVEEKTTQSYQQEFRAIASALNSLSTAKDWMAFYNKLLYWELELENLQDPSMLEMFESQKQAANHQFAKFVETHYPNWIAAPNTAPLLSHRLMEQNVLPRLSDRQPTLLVVIDNLRFDQWKCLRPLIEPHFKVSEEQTYYSILPTATQYARNALFSGLTPAEMAAQYPEFWKNDHEEGGKNMHEEDFLAALFERKQLKLRWSYHKILNMQAGKQLLQTFQNHQQEQLTVMVYNFVDMISHAKTEMEIIKELAADNKAYRSLTRSWFENSPLAQILQKAKDLGFQLLLTTDHGTLNVTTPSQVISDREASVNLRYKTGRRLTHAAKDVIHCSSPKEFGLPTPFSNSSYIFAKQENYFVYPNNYNHYVKLFENTFQHGGVSLEEMLIPFVVLRPLT